MRPSPNPSPVASRSTLSCHLDGDLSLSDAARTLSFLFLGGVTLPCLDAADTDDDGVIQLNDAIRFLNFLFLGSPQPPGSGGCAADTSSDDLGCESYPPCAI
ncbi:MAG TPA: hypothetical protein VMT52_10245 [Planctomycetota bacterium]|nr:hypothetical protein [Planctomycetota bacterium]